MVEPVVRGQFDTGFCSISPRRLKSLTAVWESLWQHNLFILPTYSMEGKRDGYCFNFCRRYTDLHKSVFEFVTIIFKFYFSNTTMRLTNDNRLVGLYAKLKSSRQDQDSWILRSRPRVSVLVLRCLYDNGVPRQRMRPKHAFEDSVNRTF